MPTPVTVAQQVGAAPGVVYGAWLDAEQLARWWWPHIADTVYQVDPRVGGGYDIRSEAAGIGAQGEFLELEPGRRIVLTWRWMNDGVNVTEEIVSIAFTAVGDGTLVGLTHNIDDIVEDPESLRQGWQDVLARLGDL